MNRAFGRDITYVTTIGLSQIARAQTLHSTWSPGCTARTGQLQRKTRCDESPIKPRRVYQGMNRAFGGDITYVPTIGLSQIAGAQMLHAYRPRSWIKAGEAGPLGWTGP